MMEGILALFETNLGFTLENIILLCTALGSMIFMAKDFRTGIIILFIIFGSEFMMFYSTGMDSFFALIAFLLTFALLALSLYITPAKGYGGLYA